MKRRTKRYDEGGSVLDPVFDWATDKDTRSVMDKPEEDMANPKYRKELERKQALADSPVGPEDLIGLGLAKRALKAVSAAEMAARPYVKNRIVVTKGIEIPDAPVRMPKSSEEITHAYRTMSKAEYEAAKKSGYFERNPNPKYPPADAKWWSGGDKTGKFGRHWERGEDALVVRTPSEKVPTHKAVRFKDVEKMKKGGKVKSASARADGCAIRGKTRA